MKLGGLLSLLLATCAAQSDTGMRNLRELESAIDDNAPRSDSFDVEGIVSCGATNLGDQFVLTDGKVYIPITDSVAWPTKTPRPGDRIRAIGRVIRQINNRYNYAKAFRIETLSHEAPPAAGRRND